MTNYNQQPQHLQGLDSILNSGGGKKTDFITFKEGQPVTLLFLDWAESLVGIREHYEPSLKPMYIRCPGSKVCPLCQANPKAYPALRIKIRVFDPTDGTVKLISLSKTAIQSLTSDFTLERVDPRHNFVTIYRFGSGAKDTRYNARAYRPDPSQGLPVLPMPTPELINEAASAIPPIEPHTPEEILGFMQAAMNGGQSQGGYNQPQHQQYPPANQYQGQAPAAYPPAQPQGGYPAQGQQQQYPPTQQPYVQTQQQQYPPAQQTAPAYNTQPPAGYGQEYQQQAPNQQPPAGYVQPQGQQAFTDQGQQAQPEGGVPPQGAPTQRRSLPF